VYACLLVIFLARGGYMVMRGVFSSFRGGLVYIMILHELFP